MKFKHVSYPYLLWIAIFIVVPLILIVVYGLTVGDSQNISTFSFSLSNLRKFLDPIYLKVLGKSINLAFISTIICLILGYPLAYLISKEKPERRNLIIALFTIPMWMNFLLRTYSWITLLGRNGFINTIITSLGFSTMDFLYKDYTVLLGMVYNFLPFMILPIYSVLVKMDNNLIEAAYDLGADKKTVFFKVVLPLSLPGVITGVGLVFIPGVSTFVISALLGGNKSTLIGNLIEQQFRYTGDWHFGSLMSLILMVIIFITIGITNKFSDGKEGGNGGLW